MITELSLFVFTLFAGLAAGAYTVSAFVRRDGKPVGGWVFPLVCLILLGVGLLGTLTHLGRPERFLLALAKPGAMIAQEAYWSMGLGIVILVDLILRKVKGTSPRALNIVGAVFAVVLMFIMGYAYFLNLGTPAWTSPATIPLFIVADLAMGAALVGVFDRGLYKEGSFSIASLVLDVLLLVTIVAVGIHFAGVGENAIPFVFAALIAPVGAGAITYTARSKDNPQFAVWVCALMVVGVAVARYAFYAGSII